jgi:hypothetical protein
MPQRHEHNNARWRRYKRDQAKDAARQEYSRARSPEGIMAAREAAKAAFAAKQSNQQRINDGRAELHLTPRHIRRRPLQEAFRKAQSK